MRSLIMLLLMALGVVFLLTQVRTVRTIRNDGTLQVIYDNDTPASPRRQTSARVTRRGTTEESVHEIKIEGQPRTSRDEAYNDAFRRAASAIEDYFMLHIKLDPEDVKRLVRDPKEKVVQLGENLGEAKQVEMTVQIDSAFIDELGHIERETRMTGRMQLLARGLAVAVAALFAIAGYVRLDEWSKGYYSGLLKAVAVLAVAGIGVAAWIK